MAKERELTITEVARMGAIARNAQLSEDERKVASDRANRARWDRLTPEERRGATAKARAKRKQNARKRARKSKKIKR